MVAAAKSLITAREVDDPDEIAAFLDTDRLYAAYALAELDGADAARSRIGLADDSSGNPIALVLLHEGLVPQSVFLMVDPE